MLNKVMIIGNLTDDPELKSTKNGVARATFTVASTRKYRSDGEQQEETTFVPVTTWRGQAKSCATYLEKGRQVAVVGRLRISNYEDDEGITRKWVNIEAEDVHFLGSPGSDSGDQKQSSPSQTGDDEEDIPF